MIIAALPNCKGCIYLDGDNLCGHWHKDGCSKLKLGVKTGKTGGCSLYRGKRVSNKKPTRIAVADYDCRVQDLYEKGMSDVEISKALGYSEYQIWHYRKKRGLPANGRAGWSPKNKISS